MSTTGIGSGLILRHVLLAPQAGAHVAIAVLIVEVLDDRVALQQLPVVVVGIHHEGELLLAAHGDGLQHGVRSGASRADTIVPLEQ